MVIGEEEPAPVSMDFIHATGAVDFFKPEMNLRRFTVIDRPQQPQGASTYQPRPDTIPGRVLAALQVEGGCLNYRQIAERFNVPEANVSGLCAWALKSGVFERIRCADRRIALRLPSAPLPTSAPSATGDATEVQTPHSTAAAIAQIEATAQVLAAALHDLRDIAAKAAAEITQSAAALQAALRALPSVIHQPQERSS